MGAELAGAGGWEPFFRRVPKRVDELLRLATSSDSQIAWGRPFSQRQVSRHKAGAGRWWREVAFYLVALTVVVADQLTKLLIQSNLALGESVPVGPVAITYITNTGSLFGLFPNQTLFLIITAAIGLAAVLVYYRYLPARTLLVRASLGLLLGGAVGNLIDRLRFGYVIDFVDLRVWPVFNLADSAVTVGILMLAWFILFRGK